MGKALCSICGSDRKTAPCQHRPGEIYQGVQCHTVLSQAVDAYEWSFVAIPAQRKAGVVKNHRLGELIAPDEVVKALGWGEEITLSPATAKGLAARIQELEALAQGGREYRENLTKEAVRLGLLGEQGLTKELLEKSLQGLSTAELAAWERHYRQKAAKVLPLLQTQGRSERGDTRELLNEEFKV